ncbi:hypothetical protein TEA_021833 [Camellia sinensis var. sinensis]|uniref:HVA22-like protein n=1 Tax=Camellia sinensis var. sinensis TaxID=542762 RepID=A0A4S4E698_CAMSN|nr:hypothetical protein TEA_021833 [Camellia sinensis var. sinensis]
MALLGSIMPSEVGLRLLLCPLGSNIVVRTACCSVGVVLPVYSTFKAIETKNQNEQQRWLIYWAAFGSFSIAEVFTDKIISWYATSENSFSGFIRFPLYYHMKFAFLVWLQLPSTDAKLTSAHQAEIQFAKTLVMKILVSGNVPNPLGNSAKFQKSFNFFLELYISIFFLDPGLESANQMASDIFHPVQRQANSAIEGPTTQVQRQVNDVVEDPTTQVQNSESDNDE